MTSVADSLSTSSCKDTGSTKKRDGPDGNSGPPLKRRNSTVLPMHVVKAQNRRRTRDISERVRSAAKQALRSESERPGALASVKKVHATTPQPVAPPQEEDHAQSNGPTPTHSLQPNEVAADAMQDVNTVARTTPPSQKDKQPSQPDGDDVRLTPPVVDESPATPDDEVCPPAEPDGESDDDPSSTDEDEEERSMQASSTLQPTTTTSGRTATTNLARKLHNRMKITVRWESMLSCIYLSGAEQFTAYQYRLVRSSLRTANPDVRLRTYKAFGNKFWYTLLKHAWPRSRVLHVENVVRQGVQPKLIKTANAGKKHVEDCVRIVFPSEWAKYDVTNDEFFRIVYEKENDSRDALLDIENTPIVQQRRIVCGADLTLWALYTDAICPCERDDKVTFPCGSQPRSTSSKRSVRSHAGAHGWTTTVNPTDPSTVHVEGRVGYVWCVVPGDDNAESEGCTQVEKDIFNALKTQIFTTEASIRTFDTNQRTLPHIKNPGVLMLCPGDVCVFLRTDSPTATRDVACVLVASPVLHAYEKPVERLVWVMNVSDTGRAPYVRELSSTIVKGLPSWISGRRVHPSYQAQQRPNKGTLRCGTPFYVYRMALYADGFKQNKSLSDSRSVTGVYMMPLGIPAEDRRTCAVTRVITLVPHGLDMRKVFRLLEADLVKSATNGVEVIDPYGKRAKVFVDLVSFFGDYPAVTAMADVRGHTANAFCTFCTMRKRDDAQGHNLLYDSAAHARRLGYMRFDMRTQAIRALQGGVHLEKALGLSTQDKGPAAEAPLVHYANRVRMMPSSTSPHSSDNPICTSLDSCLNIAAAPDHLLTGLITDALTVCFANLRTDRERTSIEIEMLDTADANDLVTDGPFLKWDKGKFDGLRSMSMKSRYAMLICAATVFDRQFHNTSKNVFMLPGKLQNLVSLVFHVPAEEPDGPAAGRMLTSEGQVRTQGAQHRAVREYITMCHNEFERDPTYGKELNKPNVHRALELCVLTIPSFGHARNCSEMVLEMAHRTFKQWLEKNSHASSHVSGVERTLLRDWLGRLFKLYDRWDSTTGDDRERAEVGLLRALLGRETESLDRRKDSTNALLREFRERLHKCFLEPVLEEMGATGQVNEHASGEYHWEMFDEVPERDDEHRSLKKGIEILQELYSLQGHEDVEVKEYRTVRYVPEKKENSERRMYGHHKVSRGCAVSAVTPSTGSSSVLRPVSMSSAEGELRFYAVYGVLAIGEDKWTVVRHLQNVSLGYTARGSSVAVLQMNGRVRRVGLSHNCNSECVVNCYARTVKHSHSVLQGGYYTVRSRRDGYPAHLG